MNRNNAILSLAVALALAGCSSYHASSDQPNEYSNTPNSGVASDQSDSSAYRNTASAQDIGNGSSNASSSRYPSNVSSNLNNSSTAGNNYSPSGPTTPAGSGVNAASASPSDNSVAPAMPRNNQGAMNMGGPGSSSVAPGQTNMMSNNTAVTPVSPSTDNNGSVNAGSTNLTTNGGTPAANADVPAAAPQLGDLNEKQTASLSTTDADKQFIKDAHGGNQYEVAAGQKALAKSQDDGVKKIAQHMVDDHSKVDDQLTSLATRIGDHDVGGLTADQLNQLAQLDKLNGGEFDAEYLRQQKAAHEQAIAEFKKEAQLADNRDLRDWATSTLPALQGHLDMITTQMSPNIGSER